MKRILSYGIGLSRQNPLRQISTSSRTILTPEELSEIHSLTLRLCDANRLHDAVRLLDASLLALPSPSSLPFIPLLVDRLSSAPSSLSHSMCLLTSLRHNPNALPSALPFCSSLLLSSYLRKRRFADAWKIFSWFLRGEDSPCRPDREMYRLALRGFCAGGRPAEGVRAAREMVKDGLGIGGEDERGWLRRSLLREARVDEALELDAAAVAGDTEELGRLLDRIIRDWQD